MVFFFLSESVCISAGPLSRTLALPVRHNGSTLSQPSSYLFLAAEHSGRGGVGGKCMPEEEEEEENVYSYSSDTVEGPRVLGGLRVGGHGLD